MLRQAIVTKYHGPGNRIGSRISATTASGIRRYYTYEPGMNSDQNHRAAAERLCAELDWKGALAVGGLKDGCVFVFVD